MTSLPGYELGSTVWESAGLAAFEGLTRPGGEKVLIKTALTARADCDPIQTEALLLEALPGHGFLSLREIVCHNDQVYGVYTAFAGKPLHELMNNGQLSRDDALTTIGAAALQLDHLHAHRHVHGHLHADSILLCDQTRQVQFTDLGYAATIAANDASQHAALPLDVLAFAAPERSLVPRNAPDYRSDFYSLGVLLYRLLLGRLPFASTSSAALIHAHRTQPPPAPTANDAHVPDALWAIVCRCLEKTPSARYASGAGLAFDLTTCRDQLRKSQHVTPFELRSHDVPTQLILSDRLYGRAHELEQLEAEYERACTGRKRLVLINGAPGIGKTVLVNQLRRAVLERGGTFVTGKHQQYQSDQPYVAVSEALRALISPKLASSDEELTAWRNELSDALGENAAVIGSVLPELGFPPPLPLPPRESRHRFLSTFVGFLAHFISAATPLVLFLDDLQWMDHASEELLNELLSSTDIEHLLVIGAYRSDEVAKDSGLARLKERDVAHRFVAIPLQPLSDDAIEQFLADSLHQRKERTRALARSVREKTGSNPFFMARFIEGLYADGLINYEVSRRAWNWDDEQLANVAITDNVVDLMVTKLRGYPAEVVETLSHMACLGGSVDVSRLAVLLGVSGDEVYRRMQMPTADGVLIHERLARPLHVAVVQQPVHANAIVEQGQDLDAALVSHAPVPTARQDPAADGYRFSHDKVEEAAYGLLEPTAREQLHLDIGQCLLDRGDIRGDDIFLVTGQFDRWLDRHTLLDDSDTVAKLYLDAGKRAKDNNAYTAARHSFNNADRLLDDSAWNTHYDLMITLYQHWAETEYLLGDLERSRNLINKALQFCTNDTDEARLIVLLIDQHTANAEYQQAIILGRNALSELGFDHLMGKPFPRRQIGQVLEDEFVIAQGYDVQAFEEKLTAMAEPEDDTLRAIMAVLMSLIPPTYFVDRKLNALVAVFMARLTYEKEFICEATPKGLSNFGNALAEERALYREGYQFARLALRIAEERYESMVPRILYCLAGSMNHWVQHLAQSEDDINTGISLCEKYGERDYNGYLRTLARCQNGIFLGHPLFQFKTAVKESLNFVEHAHNALGLAISRSVLRSIEELDGTSSPAATDGAVRNKHNERQSQDDGSNADTTLVRCFSAVLRAHNAYFLNGMAQAREAIHEAQLYADSLSTEMTLPMLNLFSSLIHLDALRENTIAPDERETLLETVHENQSRMSLWAKGCPDNFEHSWLIVEGVLAELEDRPLDAIKALKSAATCAANNGFSQFEGLAHELLARSWQQQDQPEYARGHRNGAAAAYRKWGATRVFDRLLEQFPESASGRYNTDTGNRTDSTLPEEAAVARQYRDVFEATVRALSQSAHLPSLGNDPSRQLTELTGAQRITIFIPKDGTLQSCGQFPAVSVDDENAEQAIQSLVTRAGRTGNLEAPRGAVPPTTDDGPTQPQSTLAVPVMAHSGVVAVAYLENRLGPLDIEGERLGLLRILILLAVLNDHADIYAETAKRDAKLRRYLPSHVHNAILARDDERKPAITREEIAIAFFDLRGFTAFHSSVEPEEGRRLLTEYRHAMGDIIHRYNATIDHWEGDGCMVFIAEPVPLAERITVLVDMAIELRTRAVQLITAWNADGYRLGFGIGAAYGFADCGIFGTEGRWDYSATGRYVSLASRLCDEAKHGQVLVSDRIHSAVGSDRILELVSEQDIPGFSTPMRVFNLVDRFAN